MKRLLALLVALGVLMMAAPGLDLARADDEKKEEKKKDDEKKDDKKDEKKEEKKEEKKAEKKEEKKAEEKLSDAQKEELKKLTGTFAVSNFERDGKKSTAEELKKMKVIQKGADWSFHLGDDITTGKDTPFPDKDPKEINSLYTNGPARDKVVKGIYKIDNDTVTFAWAEPDKDRPKAFEAKPDSGVTLMVLKRVSDKAEEKKDEKKEEKKEEKKDEKKPDPK